MFEPVSIKVMKTYRSIFAAILISSFFIYSCNNNKAGGDNPTLDSTSTNPTKNAEDYHPDQTQEIPRTDSSNIIGTDSVGASDTTKKQ
jgi:hypothetical protein